MSLFLTALQRWNSESVPVLVLATTNAPLERLDRALFRSGRLGEPVFVPLPDLSMVRTYIVEQLQALGIAARESEVEEAGRRALAMGLSMADVASAVESYAEKVAKGENASLIDEVSKHRPKEAPYYRRGFAEPRTEYGRRFLEQLSRKLQFVPRERFLLHVDVDEPVAIALATAVAINVFGRRW
jgi:hypothetical protein